MNEKAAALLRWLQQRASHIAPDSDLTETVLEDSLTFIELLVRVEELLGVTVATEQIDLDNFRTHNRICEVFLTADAAARP